MNRDRKEVEAKFASCSRSNDALEICHSYRGKEKKEEEEDGVTQSATKRAPNSQSHHAREGEGKNRTAPSEFGIS